MCFYYNNIIYRQYFLSFKHRTRSFGLKLGNMLLPCTLNILNKFLYRLVRMNWQNDRQFGGFSFQFSFLYLLLCLPINFSKIIYFFQQINSTLTIKALFTLRSIHHNGMNQIMNTRIFFDLRCFKVVSPNC